MGVFSCDKKGCGKKPYMELYYSFDDETHKWCYVCFWHYLEARLYRLFKKHDFGWCRVDTDREAIEHLRWELWDIQSDIMEIKEKLGIEKSEAEKEFEERMNSQDIDVT